jgi:D-beta-D-heptose 7-phosphate kinase / D-beta-D-heptose 1-phosphate adenosyltransferase
VRRFRGLRALVIGDVMLDTYLEGDAARLCAEGPVPVVREITEDRFPGGAANSAVNLSALGADVRLLSVVGVDAAGREIHRLLRSAGVDDSVLIDAPEAATLHKMRILANGQYVVRYDSGETRFLSASTRAALLHHLGPHLAWSDLVVVSDYCYGLLDDTLVQRLGALRRDHSLPLVVDSKNLARFASAGATAITPNHIEARLAVHSHTATTTPPSVEEAEQLGVRLHAVVDTTCVVVTMGAQGAAVIPRFGESVHVPAHPTREAYDVGAGDSFTAALALALATGSDAVEGARIAVDAAAIAVSRPRTTAVSHQELLQRVSLNLQPSSPR